MRPPFETFTGMTCKGCYALGSACGRCEKCVWERQQLGDAEAQRLMDEANARRAVVVPTVEQRVAALEADLAEMRGRLGTGAER